MSDNSEISFESLALGLGIQKTTPDVKQDAEEVVPEKVKEENSPSPFAASQKPISGYGMKLSQKADSSPQKSESPFDSLAFLSGYGMKGPRIPESAETNERKDSPTSNKNEDSSASGEHVTSSEKAVTPIQKKDVAYPGSVAVTQATSNAKGIGKILLIAAIVVLLICALLFVIALFYNLPGGFDSEQSGLESGNAYSSQETSTPEGESGSITSASSARFSYLMEGPNGEYLSVTETPVVDSSGIVSEVTMNVSVEDSQEALVLGFLESQFSDRIEESAVGEGAVALKLDASDLGLSLSDYEKALAQSAIDFQKIG